MRRLFYILNCLALVAAAQGSEIVRPPNIIWVANEAATGTATNNLVKLTGAPSTAIVTTAGDRDGAIGICVSGCGAAAASARASIAQWGNTSCVFDGATTAGHYIGISATVNGACTDAGAVFPVGGGQVQGRVLSTNGGAGTYPVVLFAAPIPSPGNRLVITTPDPLMESDNLRWVVYNSGVATAVTLACPTATTFRRGWMVYLKNGNAGVVTLTVPGPCWIDNALPITTLTLNPGHGAIIESDGTNYYTQKTTGVGTSGGVPYYSDFYTLGSSGLLAAGQPVLGGGVGLAPYTLGAGAGGGPQWVKYSLVAIANTVNGCANANGCWQVNGTLGAIKSAGLTQDVALTTLAARGHVTDYRIKLNTRCTGAATALSGLGTDSSNMLYRSRNYNLDQAVGDTVVAMGPPVSTGSDSHATRDVVASLITTVDNIEVLAAGCAVDVWLLQGVLP